MAEGLRERKKTQAKQVLYDAAIELFKQKGFDKTSVDEITEKAGYSRATFFNHFGSKQGVLRLYGQRLQSIVEELVERVDPSTSPLELIREIISAMVREAEDNKEEVKLICTYSMLDPDYLSDITPARKRLFEIITGLVSEAQQKKLIRKDISARELGLHIFFLYQGVVLAIVTGISSSESMLNSVWQFILKGVDCDDSSN
jgi:TetR/AcrR family transcriptional regulator, cholesterol catabolism regulator